jgi:hypothetical protein
MQLFALVLYSSNSDVLYTLFMQYVYVFAAYSLQSALVYYHRMTALMLLIIVLIVVIAVAAQ